MAYSLSPPVIGQHRITMDDNGYQVTIISSQVPRGSSGGGDAIRHGLLASAVGDHTKMTQVFKTKRSKRLCISY